MPDQGLSLRVTEHVADSVVAYVIKEMSGHKTDSVFKRYNLVTKEEMNRVKWLDEEKSLDTYMDTSTVVVDG